MFCCYLLGVFLVASLVYHPASAAVLPVHPAGDHVLILAAVNDNKIHTVSLGSVLIDGTQLKMALHGVAGSFGWFRPFCVQSAKVVYGVGFVAGVYEA